jgi:hypothetical protein
MAPPAAISVPPRQRARRTIDFESGQVWRIHANHLGMVLLSSVASDFGCIMMQASRSWTGPLQLGAAGIKKAALDAAFGQIPFSRARLPADFLFGRRGNLMDTQVRPDELLLCV